MFSMLQKPEDAHAADLITKKMFPKREEFQWRPSPILCKRFDLIDPYMGKVLRERVCTNSFGHFIHPKQNLSLKKS